MREKLPVVSSLLVSIFLFVNNFGYAAAITSRTTGGPWQSSSTWNGGVVPGPNDDVTIAGAVTISNIVANAKNITINSGRTLTISGSGVLHFSLLTISGIVNFQSALISGGSILNNGSLTTSGGTIELTGNFTNNNLFNHGNGTLTFKGSTTQTIAGSSDFFNLNVNAGAHVVIGDGAVVMLYNMLTLGGTGSSFDADGSSGSGELILASVSDVPPSDAMIATIPSGATFTGNVTVQRFMSGEGRIYRYLSSPVTNATIADWQDNFSITGNFTGASTTDPSTGTNTVCGFKVATKTGSLFYYDNSVSQYIAYPTTSSAAPLEPGRGYSVYIRQCNDPIITDVRGPINQGSIALPLQHNASVAESWNLVGNPYPSTIHWGSTSGWTKNNIAQQIAVMDNGTGVMRYSDLNLDGNNVATGQAFWVRTTGNSPSLIINETAKSSVTADFYREGKKDEIILSLSNGTITDLTSYRINADARETLDDYDAPKMNNYRAFVGEVFDLATLTPNGSQALAINAVPQIQCGHVLQLVTKDIAIGNYTLALTALSGIMEQFKWILKDKYLNKEVELSAVNKYVFTVTNDAASYASDRLQLTASEIQAELLKSESLVISGVQSSTLCNGGQAELRAEPAGAEVNINWYESESSKTVLQTSAIFTTPLLQESRTYYAAPVNSLGCEGKRVAVTATVISVKPVELILDADMRLRSNYPSGNAWYFNGVAVENSQDQTLVADRSGVYEVEVTTNGCSTRAAREVTVTDIEQPINLTIKTYPNPVADKLTVYVQSFEEDEPISASIVSSTGQSIGNITFTRSGKEVIGTYDFLHALRGIYLLQVIKSGYIYNYKIMKQ
ncbi:T9SS type A sorting domain-containing protein [Chryseosolibacter indicus]|uniref:T9SS type A sorting domain-containing protein n=1 Tax=Chryseosolibacter indicus TaxID=2782351 RepID=A0ABS5VWY4_9BACT|nr:T9SS type A sorting domain-containing protein [Chryseosolibacter indicus]MBT1705350.1 T9SS type A sorting domain-containing protein [Chryseosolibacter indicus]